MVLSSLTVGKHRVVARRMFPGTQMPYTTTIYYNAREHIRSMPHTRRYRTRIGMRLGYVAACLSLWLVR